MSSEENTMHKDFADWMSHVNIKLDRDSLDMRWQTVSRLVHEENLKTNYLDDLIQFIFGEKLPETSLEWLQSEFKHDDSLFSNDANKNQQELLALTASIIYLILEGGDDLASHAGLHILTANCSELRPPVHGDYLLKKAQNTITAHAIQIRKRIKEPTKALTTKWNATIDELVATDPTEATKLLMSIVKSNVTGLAKINQTINSLETHIATKDEELEILWWVFVEYSDLFNKPLADIHYILRTIVCGIELANHTSLGSEPPALRGLLSKCLTKPKQKISFQALGEKVGDHASMILGPLPYKTSGALTPIHYLIECMQDVGEHWQEKWSRDTRLTPDMEMTSIDLSVQFYRERLQLTNSES